jgi:hypothetical protein
MTILFWLSINPPPTGIAGNRDSSVGRIESARSAAVTNDTGYKECFSCRTACTKVNITTINIIPNPRERGGAFFSCRAGVRDLALVFDDRLGINGMSN